MTARIGRTQFAPTIKIYHLGEFAMAISKMKLVNIVGLAEDFERVCAEYLLNCSIHLENVVGALENVKGLSPYQDENPYPEMLTRMGEIYRRGRASPDLRDVSLEHIDRTTLEQKLSHISRTLTKNEAERQVTLARIHEDEQIISQLKPLLTVDNVDVDSFFHFDFVKFRFGKMPQKSMQTLNEYLYNIEAFFVKTSEDKETVWGMYFMPQALEDKIDAIFSSLYFERTRISDRAQGTPREAIDMLIAENEALKNRLVELDDEICNVVQKDLELLNLMYSQIHLQSQIARVRQYAGHTSESFYVVGWLGENDVQRLEEILQKEPDVVFIVEEPETVENITPPTRLKNNALLRPFEMFVKMYGTPGYNEIDPTPIVAISYILMFGIMFGDIGQGALLCVVGFLFAKWKKSSLGAIVGMAGAMSIIFGFIYGSIFGHEDIIHGLIEPMKNMNFMLIGAVVFGAGVIGITMILNIINGIKAKDIKRIWFSQNGVAGFVLYFTAILLSVGSVMKFGIIAAPIIGAIGLILPLILIFLQEPLDKLVKKRKDWIPKEKGMFFTESFFELFEIILSYITNSMSFIRVGAFALSHVGMMSVVFVLAKMAGSGDIVVQVFGNILVIGMEGLIVGIQVLRLEYYEMFSRFFAGDGKDFEDINGI